MRECPRLTVPGAVGVTGRFLWCRHAKQPARSAMFSARPPLANGADRGVGDTGIKRRGTELGIAIQYSVLENQVVDPIIVTAVSCSKHGFWGKGSALGLLNRENPVTN